MHVKLHMYSQFRVVKCPLHHLSHTLPPAARKLHSKSQNLLSITN